MPNYRDQIGHGFASFLADAGLLDFAPGSYDQNTEWPTFVQKDAPPTPHRMVQIAVGTIQPIRADYLAMVQVRVRGVIDGDDAQAADRIQLIQDVLYPNGFPLVHVYFGEVAVGLVAQGTLLSLPRDPQRRPSAVVNYRLRTRRPRPTSTPPAGGSVYGAGIYGEGNFG